MFRTQERLSRLDFTVRERRRWTECAELAELADLIEAVPGKFRASILRAAVSFTSEHDWASSYFVGTIRSRLFDSVYDFCGIKLGPKTATQLDCQGWPVRLSAVARASRPAEVQLALCDIFKFIAANAGNQNDVL